jgi:dihydrolipoamide dehydrogenase
LDKKDVVIIGGGTAGFLAAQSAAQSGCKVVILEKEKVGGICPNWGCIPMCYMERCVDVIKTLKDAKRYGISAGSVEIDYTQLMNGKDKVVGGVVGGMEARLKAAGIPVVIGTAKLVSPKEVEFTYDDGRVEIVQTDKIIITTGSTPRRYEVPGAYGEGVLTTRELLGLKELPESLAIIGRSVTALELATVWVNLGCKVSLLARQPRMLPNEDEESAACVQQALEEDGVKIYTGDVQGIEDSREGKTVTISGDGKEQRINAKSVVFALGQQPYFESLGLENAGVTMRNGRIETNEKMETSTAGIYAAGDATGLMMLASTAMIQGRVAGANAMGANATMDYRVVPRSVRTVPPVSAVGITEEEAKGKGLDIKLGKFPFQQNPRAGIIGESRGFVKIVADSKTGEILGAHMVGPQAPELIHEAATVMQMRGTVQDIAATIHGHPTLHETVQRVTHVMG